MDDLGCSTTTCHTPGNYRLLLGADGLPGVEFNTLMESLMKFLLTSAGIKNDSIRNALIDLLGKRLPSPAPCAFHPAIYPFGRAFHGVPVHQRINCQPHVNWAGGR